MFHARAGWTPWYSNEIKSSDVDGPRLYVYSCSRSALAIFVSFWHVYWWQQLTGIGRSASVRVERMKPRRAASIFRARL